MLQHTGLYWFLSCRTSAGKLNSQTQWKVSQKIINTIDNENLFATDEATDKTYGRINFYFRKMLFLKTLNQVKYVKKISIAYGILKIKFQFEFLKNFLLKTSCYYGALYVIYTELMLCKKTLMLCIILIYLLYNNFIA